MMQSTVVRGRFVEADNSPCVGTIRFVPEKIWIEEEDGVTYPCLAPEVELIDGTFEAELTRTDTHPYGNWSYWVDCPLGAYSIHIEGQDPLLLRDLLPSTAFE